MTICYDDEFQDWKPGDTIVWKGDIDEGHEKRYKVMSVDKHERVYFLEDDIVQMTQASNMMRIQIQDRRLS